MKVTAFFEASPHDRDGFGHEMLGQHHQHNWAFVLIFGPFLATSTYLRFWRGLEALSCRDSAALRISGCCVGNQSAQEAMLPGLCRTNTALLLLDESLAWAP